MGGRGPEEIEALDNRSVLDGLSSYLASAEQLVGIDLTLLDPSFSGDRDTLTATRAMAEGQVNEYETPHAAVMGAVDASV